MSNVINAVKEKLGGSNKSTDTTSASKGRSDEPTFSILPHPAKTNDPADLQPRTGLRSSQGAMDAFNTPGPYIPSEDIKNNLPEPLSHEELQARQASFNAEQH